MLSKKNHSYHNKKMMKGFNLKKQGLRRKREKYKNNKIKFTIKHLNREQRENKNR